MFNLRLVPFTPLCFSKGVCVCEYKCSGVSGDYELSNMVAGNQEAVWILN